MKKYPVQIFKGPVVGKIYMENTTTKPIIYEFIDEEGNWGMSLVLNSPYPVALKDIVKDLQ